jgi:choline dehydrogenase-like flavoprotein
MHPKPLRRNAVGCLGCGVCAFGCQKDAKLAMHVSYLPRAAAAGARIWSDARVETIDVRAGRVVGIEGRFRGRWGRHPRFRVRAPLVAICGGALATPLLLAQTGIRGPGRDAGKHLVLHPATKAIGVFDEDLVPWEGIPQSMYIDDLADDGILFEGASVPPDFGSIGVPLFGRDHQEMMSRYRNLGIFGLMISDSSEGRVVDLGGRPLPIYSVGRADAQKALRGLALLAEMFFEAGAKEVLAPIAGFERIRTRDDLARLRGEAPRIHPNRVEFLGFHPTGTCRMGADPARSVVDAWLETHEVRGLFVVDGSVFPSSPGVNPQETIMALATRTAERIASRRGRYV